jgi:hypothetical protein
MKVAKAAKLSANSPQRADLPLDLTCFYLARRFRSMVGNVYPAAAGNPHRSPFPCQFRASSHRLFWQENTRIQDQNSVSSEGENPSSPM